MGMRIWLDDVRPMPTIGFDIHCETAKSALKIIEKGQCDFISFDHDLGDPLDGYWLATCIENLAWAGKVKCFEWDIHSDNPAGRKNIKAAMLSAERYWNKNETNS